MANGQWPMANARAQAWSTPSPPKGPGDGTCATDTSDHGHCGRRSGATGDDLPIARSWLAAGTARGLRSRHRRGVRSFLGGKLRSASIRVHLRLFTFSLAAAVSLCARLVSAVVASGSAPQRRDDRRERATSHRRPEPSTAGRCSRSRELGAGRKDAQEAPAERSPQLRFRCCASCAS